MALKQKVNYVQHENDVMWSEIQRMNQILPGNAIGGSVTILNRNSYLNNSSVKHASGRHTPTKNYVK